MMQNLEPDFLKSHREYEREIEALRELIISMISEAREVAVNHAERMEERLMAHDLRDYL